MTSKLTACKKPSRRPRRWRRLCKLCWPVMIVFDWRCF